MESDKEIDVRHLQYKLTDFYVDLSLFIEQEDGKVKKGRAADQVLDDEVLSRVKELRGRTESLVIRLKEDEARRELEASIERRKERGF